MPYATHTVRAISGAFTFRLAQMPFGRYYGAIMIKKPEIFAVSAMKRQGWLRPTYHVTMLTDQGNQAPQTVVEISGRKPNNIYGTLHRIRSIVQDEAEIMNPATDSRRAAGLRGLVDSARQYVASRRVRFEVVKPTK